MTSDSSARVLVVDDNAADRFLLSREINRELPAVRLQEVIDTAGLAGALGLPGVIACVTDYQLLWTDGVAVLRAFKARHPDAPAVMFTGSGNETVAVEAMKAGLDDYVIKSPKGYAQAARALRRALEQAEHRRERRAAEARLEQLFHGVPVGLFVLSPEGRILDANPAAARALGVADRALAVDLDVAALFEDQETRAAWHQKLAAGEPIALCEHRLRRLDGASIWASITATPGRHHAGALIRYDGVLEDVTERRRTEALLREQADRLAEAAARKDEFLAVLAHELRNPLAAIVNTTHLLAHARDATERERQRSTIARQAARLDRMTADLLDLARLQRGKVTLEIGPIALDEVARHAAEACSATIEQRRHRLTLELPSEPVRIEGDHVRIEQIITNLLDNAARYTDPGGSITLHVEAQGDAAILRVRDTGVGIAPDLLPRLFDPFSQGERGLDRTQGGLGLGLAIVRELVHRHGGTIEARSLGRGQGSELVVRLPRREAPAATEARPSPAPPLVARRILVVEDNEDVGATLVDMLEQWGHEVRWATDGPAALALAPELDAELVLLDIGLPGMSGFDVARRLRADGNRALLVALTGYGAERYRAESSAAGFDLHMTKPVQPEALRRIIAGCRAQGGP